MPLKEHVSGGVAPSDSVVEKSVSPSCHRSANGMSVVGSHGDLGGVVIVLQHWLISKTLGR